MALGKRIEEALNRKGWKRQQLLEAVPEMSPQGLSNLIRRDSVRSELDQAIAAALGVDLLWLVYGIGENGGNVVAMEERRPYTRHGELLAIADKLNMEGNARLLGYAAGLVEQFPAQANPASSSFSPHSGQAGG